MFARHDFVKEPPLSTGEAQLQRRRAALDRQRASRTALFDLSRSSSLDDALDELALAQEDHVEPMEGVAETSTPHKKIDKVSKARAKWEKRYANKLMFAETMESLPADLDTSWIALAVPKGKRCLALTLGDASRAQTLLLSRAKGRPLARRYTSLPFGTILDCIWDQARSVLFVLDALEWSGLPLSGMDSEARRFWRDAKLAELGPQPVFDDESRLVVAPVPVSDSPRAFLAEVRRGELSVQVSIERVRGADSMEETTTEKLQLPLELDGVLLYLREAIYESGLSCLAGWLPLEADSGS